MKLFHATVGYRISDLESVLHRTKTWVELFRQNLSPGVDIPLPVSASYGALLHSGVALLL